MRVDPDSGAGIPQDPVPPAPPVTPPPAPPTGSPPPPAPVQTAGAVNALGETLAQAEAAVLALVAGGMLGADALALHPLPPGTSAATALNFLASLPQTVYDFGQPGGTVVGPPIDTLPGFVPYEEDPDAGDLGDEADAAEYDEWDAYIDLIEDVTGSYV